MAEPGDLRSSTRNAALRVRAAAWIATGLLLVSAFAYPYYPGGAASFLLFDLSFVAMLVLVLARPLSHAYVFLACMLFLGFWLKLMAHLIFDTVFLEPVGNFSRSSPEWDLALQVSAMGAIGVVCARLVHLALATRLLAHAPAVVYPPGWYVEWRRLVWIASVFAMLVLYLANVQVAFYQTGVNPKLVLPFHLNVLPGWLISIGFALWFAVLIQWEFVRAPRSLGASLLAPILESLTSSTTALSRSFYLVHSFSYFVAVGLQWTKARVVLSRRACACLVALWVLGFALSLATVSWLRIKIYFLAYEPALVSIPAPEPAAPPERTAPQAPATAPADPRADAGDLDRARRPAQKPAPEPAVPVVGATMANRIPPMMYEVSRLFLQRWIGLEAALAVSSYPRTGAALFREGLTQNPGIGDDSTYQAVANSPYKASERFTFGTLPGIVGILFYSGSLAMVVAGTLFVTLLMMTTELVALRLTANPFLVSLMAFGMANVASQMNFPYLSAIFIAQIWVAIAFVWLLHAGPQWWRRRRYEAGARA